MSETGKTSPLVAIAAISVTVFSLLGIAVMTGVIPATSSKSSEAPLQTTITDTKPAKSAATPAAASPSEPKAQAKSTGTKSAEVKPTIQASTAAPEQKKAAAQVCNNCGVVASVNAITQKGEGSGLGAVAGGVLGGVLGHQVGGGTGKKIATVAGAAGGAYAGHQVEKNMKSTTHYEVVVKMDDGSTRTFSYDTQPAFQVGTKIRIVNDALTAG